MAILILGGTAEARALAADLHAAGLPVVSSLAGRVSAPRLPEGEVRVGGFGGPQQLAQWLADNHIRAVVDATHPFAERISASAAQATEAAGVPLLRLERPGWEDDETEEDEWHWVEDLDAAATLVQVVGRRAFLTTGRQGLSAFADDTRTFFLVRCVEQPDTADLPPHHVLVLDRGPYSLEGELALIAEHDIDVIVTKDSGGDHTAAKLLAARERGLPVVIVHRPSRPPVAAVAGVAEAAAWARTQAG